MTALDMKAFGKSPPRMKAVRMKMPSRLALMAIVAIGLGSASAALAQEPSKAAVTTAREILVVKGAGSMFDPVVIGVIEQVKNSLLPTNLNVSRELNEVAVALRKEYDGKRAELFDEVARTYARHFTEQELKDLLVFYKTPLGQKWAKEEPAALEETLRRAREWSDQFADAVMGRFRNEMQKKGHPL